MDSDRVIRLSEPRDDSEIARLCLAQYKRTPWEDGFMAAEAIHIYERFGHISGLAAYRRDDGVIYVIHVWVEDGFSGRRAGVELMKDLEWIADTEGVDLRFDVAQANLGLQRAVEEHSCMRQLVDVPGAVYYRRVTGA